MDRKYINKVNIITISRVILTIIGVLLIFSGNIKLLVIAYVIMSLSEVSDIIDGYVARRDKLVTDLGKILDPLSDSISRFFYFFALAYHGLFPIWFMVFFFFRDIIVAYVRIFASFSGTVMSARFSGKLKGAVQFGGQYLLMYALMINVIQDGGTLSDTFLYRSAAIGLILNIALLLIFRIKGKLLGIIIGLMIILVTMLFNLNNIHFHINYLTTFSISFLVIGVTLYSLVDYLFSLGSVKGIYKTVTSTLLIVMMFLISPYFLDLIKNKIESDVKRLNWKAVDDLHHKGEFTNTGIVTINNFILVASTSNEQSKLFVHKIDGNKIEFYRSFDLPSYLTKVKDIEFDGEYFYLIDDLLNKVYKLDLTALINSNKTEVIDEYNTGFESSSTLATVNFNNEKFIVINDYIFSGYLYFCKTEDLKKGKNLKNQTSFKIKSEFYIKNLYCKDNTLYILANKLSKDLIYKVNVSKAVYNGDIQPAIEEIILAPDSDLKGISIMDGKLISYGNRSKKVFISE
ncbi:MAG: CDP-alcohol phosphatidyltransferase family protein [Candidatus Delongbacteria bacterium]|nr:CDP-alcohol phosphatidyltransferase family protein [Candidatus Delongbacteria bacterium]